MRALIAFAGLSAVVAPTAANAASALPECAHILPPRQLPAGQRPLRPEDLVELRDIGPVEPGAFAAPMFTISPDGRRAAFQLRRADASRNRYCLAMVILDLSKGSGPTIVDEGGDPILLTIDLRSITDSPTGIMSVISPRWSPDGRWIAFLKRSEGRTQVWRAFTDGSGSSPLTHSDTDVVDFQLGKDGSTVVYATRPGIDQGHREADAEGLSGWHYDKRFFPVFQKAPFVPGPVDRQVQVLEIATGQIREPTADEKAMVDIDHELKAMQGDAPERTSEKAWVSGNGLIGGAVPGAFHARLPDGRTVTCTATACAGAMDPWSVPGSNRVRYLRPEGWGTASTAIYEWDPLKGSVRRLYLTDDLLTSCTPSGEDLICLVDSSLAPRRLVRLDPVSGKRQLLFDPNPEFTHLALGKAERLHWRNAMGLDTIGDLVFPVGYRPGERYPLIVVQYDTRGFLRGGTGDDYPIQAFANRGYAVLSFRRPEHAGIAAGAKDFEEAGRLGFKNFADRRSIESSLETGVRLLIDRGIADPTRIGITGLSDGSTTTIWALVHSSLYSAAALSTCCLDESEEAEVGPSGWWHFKSEGYPNILEHDAPFWKDMTLTANAQRIHVPILLQLAEDEFLSSLETYHALRDLGRPVDLFEFPAEHHVKWQPAHRLAVYKRALDWFDYWLRGIRSDAPERQAELKFWDQLKKENSDATRH